ncbi:hypothetical protein V6N11_020766 [Hibiscus sabdariffa]|uniref:Cytochrome P450 n=1 Tax=Hibiscus sabdariffa TaxID=183260 RepID=A0ABR2Q9F0_9ROSI
MELQFPSLLTLLASILLLSIILQLVKRSKTLESSIQQLPPGPWRLPLVGNLHQLVGSLPHRILRDLANQHGPLMHLQLGETSNVVVSSPEIAKEILITHGTIFAQRPLLVAVDTMTYGSRDIVMAPYGHYWRQVRKICTIELLTAKRVKSFESIRQDEFSNLVKFISSNEGSPINLSDKIFGSTYGIASRAAFGSKYNVNDSYSSVVEEIVKLASGFSIADLYPSSKVLRLMSGMSKKVETLFKKSDAVLQGIIDEHRERLGRSNAGDEGEEANEDLITVLLKIQQLGDLELPLSDNDIKGIIWDVFSGGSETSSTIVDWAMSEMMRNPRVLKKAQTEVRNVYNGKGDVDEASVQELNYLELTRVIINAWAMATDPKYWTEPKAFYPERFLNCSSDFKGTNMEFIPFGAGRRMCPGILFALPNIELPLAKLLYHFDWKLPNGMEHESLDMTEAFGVTVRRKNDLILIPTIHKSFM